MQKTNSYGRMSLLAMQHRRRCATLPPMRRGEAESLIAQFLATRDITVCPARYAVPVEQRPLLTRAAY